nr:hypothetical protein [Nocardia camponoti]
MDEERFPVVGAASEPLVEVVEVVGFGLFAFTRDVNDSLAAISAGLSV